MFEEVGLDFVCEGLIMKDWDCGDGGCGQDWCYQWQYVELFGMLVQDGLQWFDCDQQCID